VAFLLDTRLGFGLTCALAMTAGVMGVVYLRDAATLPGAPAAPAPASPSWDGPVGPGALAAPAAGSTAPPVGEQPLAGADGRLMLDQALRRLFDSFLNNGKPREQALRSYLRSRLNPQALAQAESLAGDYLRYLQAEAALRAHARLAPVGPAGLSMPQVEQMQAWQQQRAQLRERMLGTAVAQAWFGAEDEECRMAFADWRKMRAPAESEEVDSNELRARRLHGAVLEQSRNERALSCAGIMNHWEQTQ
jgi:hypothetical protein